MSPINNRNLLWECTKESAYIDCKRCRDSRNTSSGGVSSFLNLKSKRLMVALFIIVFMSCNISTAFATNDRLEKKRASVLRSDSSFKTVEDMGTTKSDIELETIISAAPTARPTPTVRLV